MGLLSPMRGGFLIEDFILVKQAVSAVSVDLDMAWWAEKQIELYERRAIEPWRTSCWCHTHPEGINGPSSIDERTMAESFGRWDFALMLILTKAGVFYARMDFDHRFAEGEKSRFHARCAVQVDWRAAGADAVDAETLQTWETEFRELVRETGDLWMTTGPDGDQPAEWASGKGRRLPARRHRSAHDSPFPPPIREEEDYEHEQIDEFAGFDPTDPRFFEG